MIRQDLKDVRGIHALANLRELSLDTHPSVPIDFSALPRLERLFFRWRPGSDSLFASASLRSLYLYGYPDRDLSRIGQLGTLEDLTVNSRKVASLAGIEHLRHLTSLRLLQLSIVSLSGIEALSRTLARLEARLCRKVSDLVPVHGCPQLEFLSFADGGRLASLLPLDGLARLSTVLFPGSTVIDDGDLSVLSRLPGLRQVAFANRRHYSISVEQLRQILEARVA